MREYDKFKCKGNFVAALLPFYALLVKNWKIVSYSRKLLYLSICECRAMSGLMISRWKIPIRKIPDSSLLAWKLL